MPPIRGRMMPGRGVPSKEELMDPVKLAAFCERMLQDKFKFKLDPNDPLLAEMCMLYIFAEKVKNDQSQMFDLVKEKNLELAKEIRKREEEMLNRFFTEVEKMQDQIIDLVQKSFLDAIKVSFQDLTKKHLEKIDQQLDNKIKEFKHFGYFLIVIQFVLFMGFAAALHFKLI